MTRVEWTGNESIRDLLDVSTGACSYCGGPARVPEDVAAIVEEKDKRTPLIVCPACCPRFARELTERANEARREADAEPTD